MGAGQERSVAANDGTTLTVCRWNVEPDASSFFTVAEAGWHFAAVTDSSPVQFAIPNRAGEVVEVTGRAANVNNAECAPEVSTRTSRQVRKEAGPAVRGTTFMGPASENLHNKRHRATTEERLFSLSSRAACR